MKLLRRKRDLGTGYTVSLYRTNEGRFKVSCVHASGDHREDAIHNTLAEANAAASDLWDTARDSWDTDPWPTVRSYDGQA